MKQYASANKEKQASEVADLFRKTLETFFKEYFSNNKSLENQYSEYGNILQKNGIPKEISNNLIDLLKMYTAYNNSFVKHNDKAGKNVLEYIMYQTSNGLPWYIPHQKLSIALPDMLV